MNLIRWPASGGSSSGEADHDRVVCLPPNEWRQGSVSFVFPKFGGFGADKHSQFEAYMTYHDVILALEMLAKINPSAAYLLDCASREPYDLEIAREELGLE